MLQSVGSLAGIGKVGSDSRTDKFFVQVRGKQVASSGKENSLNNTSHGDLKLIADAGIDLDFFSAPANSVAKFDKDGKKTHNEEYLDPQSKWFVNEAHDYAKAIERCLADSNAGYVVIIEEDVFATKDFMDKLGEAVRFLQKKHAGKWTNLKLFVTDYWQNWERQTSDYITLAIGGVLFAVICELLLMAGKKRNFIFVRWLMGLDPAAKKQHSSRAALGVELELERGMRRPSVDEGACSCRWRIWFLRCYFASLGVVAMYVVSKQALNLSEVSRRGIYANAIGASSLGIAFPRNVAEEIIPFLRSNTKLPVDVMLLRFNDHSEFSDRRQYIIVPSLVQHTGMFSSSESKARFKESINEEIFYRDHMKLASKFDDLTADELWSLETGERRKAELAN